MRKARLSLSIVILSNPGMKTMLRRIKQRRRIFKHRAFLLQVTINTQRVESSNTQRIESSNTQRIESSNTQRIESSWFSAALAAP